MGQPVMCITSHRTTIAITLAVAFSLCQTAIAGQTPQTISFGAQGANVFNPDGVSFDLTPLATASSGLPVTYSSLAPTICTVSGATVSTLTNPDSGLPVPPGVVGTCTIAADQGGNATTSPAPQATQSLPVQGSNSTTYFLANAQVFGPDGDSNIFTVRAVGPENVLRDDFGTCPAVPAQCSNGSTYESCKAWIASCSGDMPSHHMVAFGGIAYLTITLTTVEPAACGSANGLPATGVPGTGLCNVGTPSTVLGTGPWTWSCVGAGSNNTASCAAPLQAPATTTVLTTACMTTFVEGQPFTAAASVTGAAPSGNVTFLQDTIPVCASVPLSGGIASCTIGSLSASAPLSLFALSASYGGDGNNAQSTSANLEITVLSLAEAIYSTGFEPDTPQCPVE